MDTYTFEDDIQVVKTAVTAGVVTNDGDVKITSTKSNELKSFIMANRLRRDSH